jgi:hypothetical protein
MYIENIGFPIPAVTSQFIEPNLLVHIAKRCAKLTKLSDKSRTELLFEGVLFRPATCVCAVECDIIIWNWITRHYIYLGE